MSTHDDLAAKALGILAGANKQPFPFQAKLAADCHGAVDTNGKLLVLAPTGSGKTLISHLLICLMRQNRSDSFPRIVVVIPSRGLLAQQYKDAAWLRRQGLAIHFLDSTVSPDIYLSTLKSFGVMYTTPITLINRLRGVDSRAILSTVDCVIFDEIDTYLTVDDLDERKDTWNALGHFLHANRPIIGFTGTSLSKGQLTKWHEYGFKDDRAEVPYDWLPYTVVNFKAVFDQSVTDEDKLISLKLNEAYRLLVLNYGQLPWSMIKNYAKAGNPFASKILQLCAERLQLFERLTDAKKSLLLASCSSPGPTLVLSRYIYSADNIRRVLTQQGIKTLEAHGNMRADQIAYATNSFRQMPVDCTCSLVITRELGGRGLDFPNAQRVHVISPRSNYQAMSQELARIRSRKSAPKSVTISYYEGTEEEYKALRLGLHLKRAKFGKDHLFQVNGIPGESATPEHDAFVSMVRRYDEDVRVVTGALRY